MIVYEKASKIDIANLPTDMNIFIILPVVFTPDRKLYGDSTLLFSGLIGYG